MSGRVLGSVGRSSCSSLFFTEDRLGGALVEHLRREADALARRCVEPSPPDGAALVEVSRHGLLLK